VAAPAVIEPVAAPAESALEPVQLGLF
jgi:hypothetical protein